MTIPAIGAALRIGDLAEFRDWLIEAQRDLELQDFVDAGLLEGDWQGAVDEAIRLLDGHEGRVGIHGPFRGFTIATPDPDVQEIVRRRMARGLDVCERLGATQMVVHSPFTTWDWHNTPVLPGARDRLVEAAHACLGAAVKRAEDVGVLLVIENIEDVDPADRRDLAASFGSGAVKLSLDTGHAAYAFGRTGAPPVDAFVRSAGDGLAHVHLQDTDLFADRHWALGDGLIRWKEVFRALVEAAPDARLILELRDKRGVATSMRYLETLGLGR